MKMLCAVFALSLSFEAQAIYTCAATSRGPVCRDVECPAGIPNVLSGTCVAASCPPGTTSKPMEGGGVACFAPLPSRPADPATSSSSSSSPACIAGYVWRVDLGRCDYPDQRNAANNATEPTAKCSMTLEWIGLDPQTAKPVSLTETQECQDGADLAGARALVQLLGGK